MVKLEEVYNRLVENKRRMREIRNMAKDELAHSDRYREIIDEQKRLREEKKSIEMEIQGGMMREMEELDELKSEIQADTELLADIALNMYVNNETVEIVDEYDVKWQPQFKVAFKRER